MTQILNITLETIPFEVTIQTALTDIGFTCTNDIVYKKSFPLSESAFAQYNAAVQAVDAAVAASSFTGKVYVQFSNVEGVWG